MCASDGSAACICRSAPFEFESSLRKVLIRASSERYRSSLQVIRCALCVSTFILSATRSGGSALISATAVVLLRQAVAIVTNRTAPCANGRRIPASSWRVCYSTSSAALDSFWSSSRPAVFSSTLREVPRSLTAPLNCNETATGLGP